MQLMHTVHDAFVPSIDAARRAYNENAQATVSGSQAHSLDTVEDFLHYHVDLLIKDFVSKFTVLPTPDLRITRKQGLKALARADTLGLPAPIYEDDIWARINLLPEDTPEQRLMKADMKIEFKDAPTWQPGNAFFETMVAAMGITADQRTALIQLAQSFV